MNSSLKPGEYAIVQADKDTNRALFVKVTAGKLGKYTGRVQKGLPYDEADVDFNADDIIAALGERPKLLGASAYGQKIEPHVSTKFYPNWNATHWFFWAKKKMKEEFRAGMSKVHARLSKMKLAMLCDQVEIEVRMRTGKYAGMYHHNPKAERDTITFNSKALDGMDIDFYHVIMHEMGHGVWFRLMTSKQRAAWIRLYWRYTKRTSIKPEKLHKIRRGLVSCGVPIKEYVSSLEDDDKENLAVCFDYINDKHSLSKDDITTLLSAGDNLKDFWPKSRLSKSDIEEILTTYAGTKATEFFAESFMFYATGMQTPKSIKELMDNTLTKLKK